MLWGVVGMLVGVIIAAQLTWPELNLGIPWLSYGRLRPLHTNAVIFAFVGNMVFAGVYHSTQRLLKTRLAQIAAEPVPHPGAEFAKFLANDVERYARLVREGKLAPLQ